jgi:uncharacterized delta-60 repeat protein
MKNMLSTFLKILITLGLAAAVYAAPADLDPSFDYNGILTGDVGGDGNTAYAVGVQSDGKILVAVVNSPNSGLVLPYITVVRYLADGNFDNSFDGDGISAQLGFGNHIASGVSMAIQSDGKIVVTATVLGPSSNDFLVGRYNSDGSLDATFDGDGFVITDILGTDEPGSVLIQPDGKIVVAGYSYGFAAISFTVVRYNSDGSLDTTFDGDGKALAFAGGAAFSVAMQADGKIVVAGYGYDGVGGNKYAVVRYNANGSLDTTFDGDGISLTRLGSNDFGYAVAVQADGRIVVVGDGYDDSSTVYHGLIRLNSDGSPDSSFDGDGKVIRNTTGSAQAIWHASLQADGKIITTGGNFADINVFRFNADGSPDTGFDGDGLVTTSTGGIERSHATAVQPDGKILVAGYTNFNAPFAAYDFFVLRYMGDSTPPPAPTPTPVPTATPIPTNIDTSFGNGGKTLTPISAGNREDRGNAVAVQSDGKMVVAGGSADASSNFDFSLARYNADGSLDMTFDLDGKVMTPIGAGADTANAVAIQADGKILAAGFSHNGTNLDFAVVRYNTDGSLDLSFDGDGKVVTPIGTSNDAAYSVSVQADGKIVVAGRTINGSFYDFGVVRYNTDGSLDSSFGTGGKVTTPFGTGNDEARSVKIQSNGKIIVAGFADNGSNVDFAAVRYNANGSLDTSFDLDGKVTTAIGSGNDTASSAAIQADDKIVLGGSSSNGLHNYFALVRYNVDGSLDTSFDFDGKVTTPVGFNATQAAIAIQSSGKILSAGFSNNQTTNDITVVRNNADGSLDNSWGMGGIVTTDIASQDDNVTAIAIQTDGKVVVAGSTFNNATNFDFFLVRFPATAGAAVGGPGTLDRDFHLDGAVENQEAGRVMSVALQADGKIIAIGEQFQVRRYLRNGSRDTSFDLDGAVQAYPLGITGANSVVVQPDGKIVIGGGVDSGSGLDFAVVRINPDGSPDATFDGDGIAITAVGSRTDIIYSLAIQTDGKIVATGRSDTPASQASFAVARYNADGSLDNTFDGDGIVTSSYLGNTISGSVAIQPDGRILVATSIQDLLPNPRNVIGLFRYNTDGSPDITFDGDGVALTPVGQSIERPSMTLQSDGKIVAVCSSVTANFDLAVVRYLPDGSLDSSFNSDGRIVTSIPGNTSTDRANAVAVDPSGNIVVAGSTTNTGNANFVVARYTPEGLPDPSWGSNGIAVTDLGGGSEAVNAVLIQPDGAVVAGGEGDLGSPGQRRLTLLRFFGDTFAPTAASVSVGGRVSASNGRAISMARVTLTNASNGESWTALTNAFGYYQFPEVLAGETYFLEASHKRYKFESRVVNVLDELADVDLVAMP